MKKESWIKYTSWIILCLLFALIFGTLTHEFLGHGLTAVYYGGNIERICVLFLNYENSSFFIEPCIFGRVWTLIPEENINNLSMTIFTIMGSVTPFIISLLSLLIIIFANFRNFYLRTFFYSLSLWVIDPLFNYVRPYIFGGGADFQDIIQYNTLLPLLIGILASFIFLFAIYTIIVREIFTQKISSRKKYNTTWEQLKQAGFLSF